MRSTLPEAEAALPALVRAVVSATIGGIDRITTGSVVVGNGSTVAIITGSITIVAGVGISVGVVDSKLP